MTSACLYSLVDWKSSAEIYAKGAWHKNDSYENVSANLTHPQPFSCEHPYFLQPADKKKVKPDY